ncbi:MAG: AAA family ATPase [Sphingomonas sp.]
MRRIEHRGSPPKWLFGAETTRARDQVREFLDLPPEQRESRRAPVDEKMFHHPDVISALQTLFHDKCAYCETKRGTELRVDHHRPIANAGGGRKRLPHHYAWLAYEWENLLFVCQQCSDNKRNQFPVRGGRADLLAPLPLIRARESPKLLDPGYDRPERHLEFSLDGMASARSTRAAATIQLLQLNRPDLIDKRRSAFDMMERMSDSASLEEVVDTLAIPEDDALPFVGCLRILRFRFLLALAERVDHFTFGFDDTRALIESVMGRATIDDVRKVLDTLRHPSSEAQPLEVALSPGPHQFTPPIRSIEIRNFKGIGELVLDLESQRGRTSHAACLMLLGENATGKSTVLEAVTLALSGTTIASKLANPRDFLPKDLGGLNPRTDVEVSVTIQFWGGESAELKVTSEKFEGTSEPSANVLAYGSRRYFKPGRRKRSKSGGPKSLFDPSWTLPHPDIWLGSLPPGRLPEIARALGEMLSLPKGQFIKSDKARGAYIVDGKRETPLALHSDGYRSIFATAVDIMRGLVGNTDLIDAQGVVLIDEIETHLHPRWKMRVMGALRQALPKVQFIVTTHDPLCLRGMGAGEVQVMTRNETGSIVRLSGLPDASALRIDQILTSEHFGLQSTLDPSFQDKFDRYYSLLRQRSKSPGVDAEIDRLRREINETQKLGQTERERVLLEAIDRHLAIRSTAPDVRRVQDEALAAEIDAIWEDAGANRA